MAAKINQYFSFTDSGTSSLVELSLRLENRSVKFVVFICWFQRYRVKCESLHSDKTQEERTSILENFRNGLYDILVSTNVMGRGIDLQSIRQVIQYLFQFLFKAF